MAGTSMRQYGGRNVWVHLPPSYSAKGPRHPLLVLHDGQNLSTSRPEARGGSWLVDETVDRLSKAGTIPPLVVAGIDHAESERVAEFSLKAAGLPNPKLRDYARLVLDEIVPGLADEFSVRTDAKGLALGGSSMGGLATIWMAAMYPGRFGRLLAMSPSVWWGRREILRVLLSHPIDPATRVWIDAGAREGARVARDAKALGERLRLQGCDAVQVVRDTKGDHSESSWARRLPDALTWLYENGASIPE